MYIFFTLLTHQTCPNCNTPLTRTSVLEFLKKKEENPNAKVGDPPLPSTHKDQEIIIGKTAAADLETNKTDISASRVQIHEESKADVEQPIKSGRTVNLTPVEVLVTKNADESKDMSLQSEDQKKYQEDLDDVLKDPKTKKKVVDLNSSELAPINEKEDN